MRDYVNNFNLVAEPPLGFNQKKFKNLILFEELEYSLISVSLSDNHYTLFKKNIFNSFKLDLPKVGSTKISTVDNTKIIALQPNQYFFMYKRISDFPVDELKSNVGIGYFSDQSDSWSIIKISGENTIHALERICPIDLSIEKFKIDGVSRTQMEHLSVIMIRIAVNEFILMSPRSSSHSFYHILTQSAQNIL